ncbi:hypothetical protein P692DRAFT_20441541 [Suillus brevipes Sb2]|nr:hypothetical protein P692DRAFT_20441541 [Suillus brevipes Sb2]
MYNDLSFTGSGGDKWTIAVTVAIWMLPVGLSASILPSLISPIGPGAQGSLRCFDTGA